MKCSLLGWVLLCGITLAGDAAFLADGKRVVRADDKVLRIKTLGEPGETELKLPEGKPWDHPALTRLKDGRLLVAGGQELMTWNPGIKEWKDICKTPEGLTCSDVACDAKSGLTVVVLRDAEGEVSWRVLPPEKVELVKVFNRRAGGAHAPVFDLQGNLYYCRAGDVWKGGIEFDSFKDDDNKTVERYILSGTRIWPVAEHETSGANNSGTGALDIAPLEKNLLVDRSRMGGSGWGNLIMLPNADAYEKKLPLSLKELTDTAGAQCATAVSPDGKRAAVYLSTAKNWFTFGDTKGELIPEQK